ncbi:MAG: hypothetical protein KDC66_07325 [Phaeodactylibacter sp.]|nr:hypothetical protein [Phaeodactylibacter sp.]MCB9275090.1 hypothetical protein [Lewinellaceae bacterium]
MRYRKNINIEGNPFSSFFGIIFIVLFLVGLYFLARFIFTILYYLSPILLIATLIVDYKVVVRYVQWLIALVRQNPLMGAGSIALSVLGFPVLAAFLLGKALFKKRVKQAQADAIRSREGEFVDFEELEMPDDVDAELPRVEPQPRQKPDTTPYDDFFKEQ